MSAMSNSSLRRYLVYLIAAVVIVGIFFSHDSLKTSHLIHSHSSSRLFHVDQNFLSNDKQGRGGASSASQTKIKIHGDFSLSELQHEIKKIKETHKKAKKDKQHSNGDAAGSSSPSKPAASQRSGSSTPVHLHDVLGKRHQPFTLSPGSDNKGPSKSKRTSHPASTGPSSSTSSNMKRIAADLEKHRANNPTFAKKDPFEEKCVTNTLADRLERTFKDNYIAARENHAYRSNFKVPKYWPLHMRGNNICKHIKWQVVGQVNNKVSKLLPPTDWIKDKLKGGKDKYRSCAVVGNGGGSLLKDYGKYIDDHELVLRFNGGPTAGYEKHVGSKTTFRITNSEHFFFHEKPTNETVLQHITNSKNFKQLFKVADRDALKDRLPNLQIIDPFFQYYVLNLHNDGAPSNGFYGIALANLICNRITLFGYQKEWKHMNIPYHYYDKVEPNSNQYGRDLREVQRFEELLSSINLVASRDPLWVNWQRTDAWHLGKKIIMADDLLEYLEHPDLYSEDSHSGAEDQDQEGLQDDGSEGDTDVVEEPVAKPTESKGGGFLAKLFGNSKSPSPQPHGSTSEEQNEEEEEEEEATPSSSSEEVEMKEDPQTEPETETETEVETEAETETEKEKPTKVVAAGDDDSDSSGAAAGGKTNNPTQAQEAGEEEEEEEEDSQRKELEQSLASDQTTSEAASGTQDQDQQEDPLSSEETPSE